MSKKNDTPPAAPGAAAAAPDPTVAPVVAIASAGPTGGASKVSTTSTLSTALPLPNSSSTVDATAAIGAINQSVSYLTQIIALISYLLLGTLSAKDSRALLKARKSGQILIPMLVNLVGTRPALAPNGNDAATVQAKFQILQAFQIFAQQLNGLSKDVQDTLRQMQVGMYRLALDIYAIAERSGNDSQVQTVVEQVKAALKTGPRSPKREVNVLEPPVTVRMPAAAVGAAQTAAEAVTGAGSVTVAGSSSSKKKSGSATANGGSSGSGAAGAGAVAGTGGGAGAGAGTAAAPQVPVYSPGGQVGTAPATNAAPAAPASGAGAAGGAGASAPAAGGQVPVYTPGGQAGTAPATNVAPAGGTGSTGTH